MNEPFDSIAKIFLGVLVAWLFASWRERIRCREVRELERLDAARDRLRSFRNDISEIIARLGKVSDDGVRAFSSDTREQVLVFCARVSEDIPTASAARFDCACHAYCDIQERDNESGIKFLSYRLRTGRHYEGGVEIPNPFQDDKRPRKERMLDALQKLRDYAK